MKWTDQNAITTTTPVHERVVIGQHCHGAILSRSAGLSGYFLSIHLEAGMTTLDGTLAECKRDFLKIMLPKLEANLAEVKRIVEEETP